jgi:hypothetical protein
VTLLQSGTCPTKTFEKQFLLNVFLINNILTLSKYEYRSFDLVSKFEMSVIRILDEASSSVALAAVAIVILQYLGLLSF